MKITGLIERSSGEIERQIEDADEVPTQELEMLLKFEEIEFNATHTHIKKDFIRTIKRKCATRKYYWVVTLSNNSSINPICEMIYTREKDTLIDYLEATLLKAKYKKMNIQAFIKDEGKEYLVDLMGESGISYDSN